MAFVIGGTIAAVGAIGGGLLSSNAAQGAASTQANAATQAASTQAQAASEASQNQVNMFNAIKAQLAPFVGIGTGALTELSNVSPGVPGATGGLVDANGNPTGFIQQTSNIGNALASSPAFGINGLLPTSGDNLNLSALTQPFNPTMADLENTPGYKFTLNQGLQAVQNGYAAQGLGTSGAALKGAAQYASGLASTTYNQQLQNYLQQNQQRFNDLLAGQTQAMGATQNVGNILQGANTQAFNESQANQQMAINQLLGLGTIGANAGAQTATSGVQSQIAANQLAVGGAQAQAAGITGAGNALAAGQVGSANALAGAFGGIGNSINNSLLTSQLLANNNNNMLSSGFNPGFAQSSVDFANNSAFGPFAIQ